jgi:hypothetical protein
MIVPVNRDCFLKQQQPPDVCNGEVCVLFEVWFEFLNIMLMSFSFKGYSKTIICGHARNKIKWT